MISLLPLEINRRSWQRSAAFRRTFHCFVSIDEHTVNRYRVLGLWSIVNPSPGEERVSWQSNWIGLKLENTLVHSAMRIALILIYVRLDAFTGPACVRVYSPDTRLSTYGCTFSMWEGKIAWKTCGLKSNVHCTIMGMNGRQRKTKNRPK